MDSLKPSGEAQSALESTPCLRRVSLRNYKSIERADISLGALTILVGRNGSGKSNFLDALRFVSDSLQASLDHAIKLRGGFGAILHAAKHRDPGFQISVEAKLSDGRVASYTFRILLTRSVSPFVRSERLIVRSPSGSQVAHYAVMSGEVVESSVGKMPPASSDRLYLVSASGFKEFRSCYDVLSSMSFYNLNPGSMKTPQPPDTGGSLQGDGSNLASIVANIKLERPDSMDRIISYLSVIVPGIVGVERIALGPLQTLLFQQKYDDSFFPHAFYSWSMSDGTLRALGALVAVNQLTDRKAPMSLVGIEEPETALHPAAAGALMDALREASSHTQVIVTSHSPDLLDQVDLEKDCLLAVVFEKGKTMIGPIDTASREAIRRHLYSPGELLRLDQLEPDRKYLQKQKPEDDPVSDGDEA